MSFAKLPTEVLDQVCEEVGKFKAKVAITTLYNLSLTCRTSLSSARRELYRSPLRLKSFSSEWPRAVTLLRTLSTSPHLSAHVKRLSNLHSVVLEHINRTRNKKARDLTAALDPRDWQEQLVRLCTNLRNSSLYLKDVVCAQGTSAHISSRSHLERLKLFLDSSSNDHEVFAGFIQGFDTHPLTALTLDVAESPSTTLSRQKYSVRHLNLDTCCPSLNRCLPFLPRKITSLTSLTMSFEGFKDTSDVSAGRFLSALSRNHLQILSLAACSVEHPSGNESYINHFDGSSLPVSFFSTFPSLRVLKVEGFAGISTEALAKLADTSVKLKKLSLSTSIWTLTADDLDPPTSPGPSKGEGQIIDALRRMPKLKKVDFGILPYKEREREYGEVLMALEEFCRERRLEMEVEGFDSYGDSEYDSDGDVF